MLMALVSECVETVCSFFVGPKIPKNCRDLLKSNGGVGVSSPDSVYKFNLRFPNKLGDVLPGQLSPQYLHVVH